METPIRVMFCPCEQQSCFADEKKENQRSPSTSLAGMNSHHSCWKKFMHHLVKISLRKNHHHQLVGFSEMCQCRLLILSSFTPSRQAAHVPRKIYKLNRNAPRSAERTSAAFETPNPRPVWGARTRSESSNTKRSARPAARAVHRSARGGEGASHPPRRWGSKNG